MKYLHLVWANLRRRRLRSLLTVLSILVAFILYGLLSATNKGFNAGVDLAGNDRLVTIHKVSLIQPLPVSYQSRIETLEGVDAVTYSNWFGGIYQDPKNFFPQMAVDPAPFLDLYPEYVLSPEELEAWKADRTGAVVGRALAEKFGWKVGDRIPIQGTIYRNQETGGLWEFNLVGLYEAGTKDADETQFLFRYDYLNEGMGGSLGVVGWYIVRIADPDQAPQIAEAIDSTFANSPAETKTTTEKAFGQAFAQQVGNTAAIIRAVLAAVFFTILLVVGNTMAQSVRERTNELAVLKAMGFSNGRVMALVLAESCLLALVGGALGLLVAAILIQPVGKALSGFLPVFYMPPKDMAIGIAIVLLLGLVTGVPPALQAMRLQVADALRRA
ncbi:MAG: FtsX-like permease family protein [Deltaproteobacteria bacterium]|nr:FtsX-like permease family protein [Deltaproteobacteria bacterium]